MQRHCGKMEMVQNMLTSSAFEFPFGGQRNRIPSSWCNLAAIVVLEEVSHTWQPMNNYGRYWHKHKKIIRVKLCNMFVFSPLLKKKVSLIRDWRFVFVSFDCWKHFFLKAEKFAKKKKRTSFVTNRLFLGLRAPENYLIEYKYIYI